MRVARQQHERERDADDDEPRLQSVAPPTANRRTTFTQHLVRSSSSAGDQGNDAEHHGRDQRERKGESDHTAIELDVRNAGQAGLDYSRHRAKEPVAKEQPHAARQQGQEETLGQQHLKQARPRGAECGADADLALAHHRPAQHQIRDVGARHQEHESDGGEQDEQWPPHRPRHIISEGNRSDRERGCERLPELRRILLEDSLRKHRHIGCRLCRADAVPQPADD